MSILIHVDFGFTASTVRRQVFIMFSLCYLPREKKKLLAWENGEQVCHSKFISLCSIFVLDVVGFRTCETCGEATT